MRKSLPVLFAVGLMAGFSLGQKTSSTPKPPPVVPIKDIVGKASDTGQVFTSQKYNFSITFPHVWRIRDDNFEEDMLGQGFDIRLKAPSDLAPSEKIKLMRSLRDVEMLVIASRALPYTADNAILQVTAEDLRDNLQIKDAVDYFDAVRQTYASMRLPKDFEYSETQAEKLGTHQYAFLDVSSNAGKKRLYATVRNHFALLFTLSYVDDDDLQDVRKMLGQAKFKLN